MKPLLASLPITSVLYAALLTAASPSDPKTVLLWPDGAPGAQGTADADQPKFTVFLPAKPIGSGVVVFPGGGYVHLAMDHEGTQIARWLNSRGVAAFVLQYRLGPKYRHPIELNDAKRAIRLVRANASAYGINPARLGIWGFSAGGHLASTLSTHFDSGDPSATDPADRLSSRPDFAILAYPVITFGPFAHRGSQKALLGDNPEPALIENLSNEKQVTANTPPTFLFHTADDAVVPVENSLLYYEALRKNGVPSEMHIYQHGPHGVGLAWDDPILGSWPGRLSDWLRFNGWLDFKENK